MSTQAPPDALMFLSSRCPHCPTVLAGLVDLIKQGGLRRLEVVNLEQAPDLAGRYGVRSVPWVRLGPFDLIGLHSPDELRRWAAKAGSLEGLAEWCVERLGEGNLSSVLTKVHEDARFLDALLQLLADESTSITVRVGIGAVIEDLAGSPALAERVGQLGALTKHPHATVRADAVHFLGFVGEPARPFLERAIHDPDEQVRGIAAESLERLAQSQSTR